MKRLTITYDSAVLFDGEVEELSWQDAAHQVSVVGKLNTPAAARPAAASPVSGLMDLLTGVSKTRTAEVVKERKRELVAEREEAVREATETYARVAAHEEPPGE